MLRFCVVLCVALFASANAGFAGGKSPITDPDRLKEVENTVTVHLEKLGVQENGKPIEFIKIHSATTQTVAGSLVEALALLNENDKHVNCTIKIWEKLWENFVKFDVECGEGKRKYQWQTPEHHEITSAEAVPVGGFGFGAPSPLSEEGIKALHPKIQHSFNQLSTNHTDFDYHYLNIVHGTHQVVAGSRYDVTLKVKKPNEDEKHCNANILETLEKFKNFHFNFDCDDKTYTIQTDLPKED